MLVTQNYGRGRTAVLATSGTWRWQMSMPLGDTSHEMFWQQLLRWLVSDTPGHVVASASNRTLLDDGHIHLSADVRDADYQPAPDAKAEAHILGPGGISSAIEMSPVPDAPGSFQADWTADKAGSYIAEVTAQKAANHWAATWSRLSVPMVWQKTFTPSSTASCWNGLHSRPALATGAPAI